MSTEEALEYAQGKASSATLERVETHADRCAECREMLNEALRGLNTSPQGSAMMATTFQVGMVLGERFEIRRFVDKGGMGEVYEAFDRELDTSVALKTVAIVASNSDRAARYLRAEVLLARSIAHPNVCRIFEWGTHVVPGSTSKICFFTMEFIEGQRLGTRLRQGGPLPLQQATDVARQLLAGLAAAHAAGTLHRDFKSDNVILGKQDRAVILDFGLARPLNRELGSSSFRREGTWLYMAPEQHEGKQLGPTADLYAFGVVLFEMLTGRRPFVEESGLESPVACLSKTPVAPSRFNSSVSRKLDTFVLRCLRRDPRERFQSARQALSALEALMPAPVEPSAVPLFKRRGAVAAAGVALTGAVMAFAYARAPERPVAPQPTPTAKHEATALAPELSLQPALPPTLVQPPMMPSQTLGPPAVSGSRPKAPLRATRPSRAPSAEAPGKLPTSAAAESISSAPGVPASNLPSIAGKFEPFEGPKQIGRAEQRASEAKNADAATPF